MIQIGLNEFGHEWHKQNLVTIMKGRRGSYDIMKCSKCGIMGKTSSIATIRLKETYKSKIYNCNSAPVVNESSEIVITKCFANGPCFANLLPGSKHKIVTPPNGYKNDNKGVWVMGIGGPVKVLNNEFEPPKD